MKELEKALRAHLGHDLVYLEKNGNAWIKCKTCMTIHQNQIATWPLASLEPNYELHQAVDAIQATVDTYFPDGWGSITFDYDRIDNRIDEMFIYDAAKYDITHILDDEYSSVNYEKLLNELEEAQDFFELMNRGIREVKKGEYPKEGDD